MSKAEALAARKRGLNYYSGEEWNKAIEEYTKAINLYDKDHSCYYVRSRCYAEIAQFDKAFADGQKCIELQPDSAKGYERVAYALFKVQIFDEAKSAYEIGLKIDPNDPVLKYLWWQLNHAINDSDSSSSSDSYDSSDSFDLSEAFDSSESSSPFKRYSLSKDLKEQREKIKQHLSELKKRREAKKVSADGTKHEDDQEMKNEEQLPSMVNPAENDQVQDEELHELIKALAILEKLHTKWYRSKDINVRNLAIYLKDAVDGYRASIDRNADHGYSKFGTYARSFCEAFCNYLLKKVYEQREPSLAAKTKELFNSNRYNRFPKDELDFVREKTNKVVHAVGFNEDARKRFMSDDEHHVLIMVISYIASWLNKNGHIHT